VFSSEKAKDAKFAYPLIFTTELANVDDTFFFHFLIYWVCPFRWNFIWFLYDLSWALSSVLFPIIFPEVYERDVNSYELG